MIIWSPIDAARSRLRDALLAGQDTAPHRRAIAKLEATSRAAQERVLAAEHDETAARTVAAQARATGISIALQARIDAMLEQFPLPAALEELQRAAHLPGTKQ